MREIQYKSRPGSGSSIEDEDTTSETDFGWEVEDHFKPRKENLFKINSDLIVIANKKVPLSDIFNSYHINFDSVYSPSGWTHKRRCPFPDHNDSTPSFNYNVEENRFYCFGCKRGGQAVQFVSAIEEISLIAASEKILDKFSSLEDIVIDLQDNQNKEIDKSLFDFSDKVHNFIVQHTNSKAIEYVESVTWCLDIYLHKHVPRSTLDVANLNARIQLLLKKLEQYEQ